MAIQEELRNRVLSTSSILRSMRDRLSTTTCLFVIAVAIASVLECRDTFASTEASNGTEQLSTVPADPTFAVATIKLSNPNDSGWGLGTRGNHFWARNVTLIDLISFAYGLHAKQIGAGGSSWVGTEKFDVEGVPDFEGRPLREQLQTMLKKLLASRFQLMFHMEKQKLAVYALVVANGGVKFRRSDAPPEARSGYSFPDIVPVAQMKVMRMTMPDFASALQRTVLDRPVINETSLPDRYDFVLQWTPDESQFIQFRGNGVVVPSGGVEGNAPPGLFTAIESQLGLKLEAKKEMDDVLVIDRVEQPTAN